MPEVFVNYYRFADARRVPGATTLRDALARALDRDFAIESHARGDHGADRAYALLQSPDTQITICWEHDAPEVEISIDEPMERMLKANAALRALGGEPQYADEKWIDRRRGRTIAAAMKAAWLCVAVGIAIAIVWFWSWWGVLAVVGLVVLGTILFTLALARAFAKG